MRNKIELLAPAGGLEQFFAAVENGADAVYLGGYKFNARMKADNFTESQLSEAINYAHLRNAKVYVTVNTLLSDEELPDAAKYCVNLHDIGADGLIVQDLGLAHWVKAHLPDFPLHLSTQGTVYNTSGVKAAEDLGFSRVVLARETSLDEIKKITNSSNMEIEMFIHGALCMCYSGQCQMSRVIGGINGRSGNRGLCAQPCRLPYSYKDRSMKYPLSPKDLCTVDYLPQILDAGVTSLKIEGRMKSPEYVAIVTSIYRKYLDEYLENGAYEVDENDRDKLRQIYSRGTFTTGYVFGDPKEDFLTDELPNHQGICIGKVTNVLHGKKLIDIETPVPLSLGDGIEIRNKSRTRATVTYLEIVGHNIYRIGDIKDKVEIGQPVYRTIQASLLKEARKTYEGADFVNGKSHKRIPINLKLKLDISEHPSLKITEGAVQFNYIDESAVVETALNKPLEKSLAERQLRKTGNTCFAVKNVEVEIEDGSTLPLSALNKLRRDALTAYSDFKTDIESNARELDFSFPANVEGSKELVFYFFNKESIDVYDFRSKMDLLRVSKAKIYLPLLDYMDGLSIPDYLEPVPYISNISKGRLDEYIEENFIKIVDKVRSTGIAIGNLGWCEEFAAQGITVYGDYGLNLNNENAKAAIKTLGVSPAFMSLESQSEGGWPLMITEYPLTNDEIIDRKNQAYHVINTSAGDKWMLFKTTKPESPKRLLELWKTTCGELRIFIGRSVQSN